MPRRRSEAPRRQTALPPAAPRRAPAPPVGGVPADPRPPALGDRRQPRPGGKRRSEKAAVLPDHGPLRIRPRVLVCCRDPSSFPSGPSRDPGPATPTLPPRGNRRRRPPRPGSPLVGVRSKAGRGAAAGGGGGGRRRLRCCCPFAPSSAGPSAPLRGEGPGPHAVVTGWGGKHRVVGGRRAGVLPRVCLAPAVSPGTRVTAAPPAAARSPAGQRSRLPESCAPAGKGNRTCRRPPSPPRRQGAGSCATASPVPARAAGRPAALPPGRRRCSTNRIPPKRAAGRPFPETLPGAEVPFPGSGNGGLRTAVVTLSCLT